MLGYWTIMCTCFVVVWAAFFRPSILWYLYAAALPLFGVIAEVGLQVTPVLTVSVGMFIAILIAGLRRIIIPKVIFNYLFYSFMITVIMSFNLPEEVKNYSMLRGQFRWVAQIFVTLLFFMPILFLYIFTPGIKQLRYIMNTFLGVVTLLGVLGILQIIIFKLNGTDLFPIDLFNPQNEKSGLRSGFSDLLRNSRVLRMSSLGAGEPKHFGYTCVIALTLVILRMSFADQAIKRRKVINLFLIALFTLCTIYSLSTQAFLILGVNAVVIYFFLLVKKGLFSKSSILYIFFICLMSIIIIRNDYVNLVVQSRIFQRLDQTGAVEDFNLTIIDFLKGNPQFIITGTGLGQVHLFSQKYIPREFRYYMRDSVYVAKAGFLRILSEQGLIGIILWFSLIGYLAFKLIRLERCYKHGLVTVVLVFLIIVNCDYLISSDSSPYYIFTYVLGFIILRNHASAQQ